jgi:hypothetical protein
MTIPERCDQVVAPNTRSTREGQTDLINSSPKSRGSTSISSTNGPGTGTLPAADHRRRSVCPTDKSSPTHALEMARHESRGLTGHPGLLIG